MLYMSSPYTPFHNKRVIENIYATTDTPKQACEEHVPHPCLPHFLRLKLMVVICVRLHYRYYTKVKEVCGSYVVIIEVIMASTDKLNGR